MPAKSENELLKLTQEMDFSNITKIERQEGGSVPKRRICVGNNNSSQAAESIWVEKIQLGEESLDVLRETLGLSFYRLLGLAPRTAAASRNKREMKQFLRDYFRGNTQIVDDILAGLNSRPQVETNYLSLLNSAIQQLPSRFFDSGDLRSERDSQLYLTFLSEYIANWQPLGTDFMAQLHVPGSGLVEVETRQGRYPLIGVGAAIAIALIIDDPDFIGGSGSNLGYVIDEEEKVAYVKVIDAGESFNAKRSEPYTLRNVKFAKQGEQQIQFDNLSLEHKDEFLQVLHYFSRCQELDEVIDFLIKQVQTFNGKSKQNSGNETFVLLSETQAAYFKGVIRENIVHMADVYQEELRDYVQRTNSPTDTNAIMMGIPLVKTKPVISPLLNPYTLFRVSTTVASFVRAPLPRALKEAGELYEHIHTKLS